MDTADLALKGKHNQYNSMAAGVAANVLQIKNDVLRESLMAFSGIEHRLEIVFKIRDVLYINDSKATNVNSTWYALESMVTPTIWIAGGQDKGNDYSTLRELVRKKVKALICLGVDNEKLIKAFSDIVPCYEARTMKDAVNGAYNLAEKGETILLSPACASFDLFKNYEDRGNQFKTEVRKL
jgi:UDP-N-acetylmuramoylalanine--D-glutamate ligase